MRFSYGISRKISPVVLSRNLPQLGIANLSVRDQLLEIGSQQLLSNHQESNFLTVVFRHPLKPLRAAACATMAGWATGTVDRPLRAPEHTLRITPPAVLPD